MKKITILLIAFLGFSCSNSKPYEEERGTKDPVLNARLVGTWVHIMEPNEVSAMRYEFSEDFYFKCYRVAEVSGDTISCGDSYYTIKRHAFYLDGSNRKYQFRMNKDTLIVLYNHFTEYKMLRQEE